MSGRRPQDRGAHQGGHGVGERDPQLSPHIAFGGHKQSGIGIENAQEVLAEFTNSQTFFVSEACRTCAR